MSPLILNKKIAKMANVALWTSKVGSEHFAVSFLLTNN